MRISHSLVTTHPANLPNRDKLVAGIDACFDCGQACTTCADACLFEDNVPDLRHCIRTNLDCADLCLALGRSLSRASQPEATLMKSLLQACIDACMSCGEECRKHATMHEHCGHCAEACAVCERACRALLPVTPA